MVYALDRAAFQDFANLDTTTPKKIVLITDGGENCGGDPCAFAKNLMKKRSDIHIDVVLVSSNSKYLSGLSSTTGGHFYNVNKYTKNFKPEEFKCECNGRHCTGYPDYMKPVLMFLWLETLFSSPKIRCRQ